MPLGKWNGSTVCCKIAQKPVCNCLRTQYRLISTVYDKPCRYCEDDISTLTVLPVRNNLTEEQCEKSSSCVGFARRPGQLSCYILELPDVDGDQAISLIQEGSFPDFAGRDSVVIHRKRLNSTIDVCEESDCQRITTKRACEEAVSGLFTEGQVLYVDSPCVTLVNTKLCPAGRLSLIHL